MTLVKICGLSEPETLDAAISAEADLVGFVFYPPSPRAVDPARAAGLAARTPAHIGRVGVFVDPDDDLVDRAVREAQLTAIQLHGSETAARVLDIKRQFGRPVWKAAAVRTRADIDEALKFRGIADCLLFDAKGTGDEALPGGNGLSFDWRLLEGIGIGMAWCLSGGLDADNVREARALTRAPLVDVSSGVEDAPGVKSAAKIRAFMKAVRDR